jgi:hypothetical protein
MSQDKATQASFSSGDSHRGSSCPSMALSLPVLLH